MTVSLRTALLATLFTVSVGESQDASAQRPVDCMLVTQVPVSECQAMFDLFFSLNGTTWVTNTGWLLAGNVCEWQGVDCSVKEWPRNITEIILHDNDLSGSIPESIALLPELRTLILNNTVGGGYFNRIEGNLPSALGSLEQLEVLDLSRNNISGNIPVEYGNLKKLRILKMDENQLDGPVFARLYGMEALEEIDLSENNLEGTILPDLARLNRLRHIDLSSNQFVGSLPEVWDSLAGLQSVQLQNNRFTGRLPQSLVEHDSLRFLKAYNNAFVGAISPSAATRLARLNVCELENNTGGLCHPDTPLYGTQGVCNLGPRADCSYCRALTDISGEECAALEKVFYETGGPEWTNRDGWFETSSACQWFGVGCQDQLIVRLTLPANNLAGRLPVPLAALPALTDLDLSGNNLSGPVPLALAERAAAGLTCALTDNTPGLCVPNTEPYRALGVEPVCGLPLVTACSAPAAIRLVSFSGRLSGLEIVLSWEASSSLPGIRYTVEQRTAESFVPIGNVNATTITTSGQPYEFRFIPESQGVGTFRLRQRNLDGTETVSDPIDILIGPDQRFLVISPYPNPFSGRAELAVGVRGSERVRVAMYDLLGRQLAVLLDESLDAGAVRYLTLDAAGFADGVYLIRVDGEDFTTARLVTLRR
ncbi:MAG: hypothetical protein SH809_01610 [Rhodothermales bacterium]|nr:hypothetical protein [Rhodothermales bacterium]